MVALFLGTLLFQVIIFQVGAASVQIGNWCLGIEPDFKVPMYNQITAEKIALGRCISFTKSFLTT